MKTSRMSLGAFAILGLLLAVLLLAQAPPALAGEEDVAMFYDSLASYGNWVDYGDNGPVWYPSQVESDWRPYVDGRWTPTDEGWVFETDEPWGWATYHYGNWFPTAEYGWVWAPGSTWYPNSVAWRADTDYVGWAPIPPPTYTPEPAFYPEGGYYPGLTPLDLISAPFWIMANAANFLLGFGAPYAPAYSYYGCGCLTPFDYVPFIFPAVPLITDCFYPSYAPNAYYFFGPSFPYAAQVTNININRINIYANRVRFDRIRNGVPPSRVLNRDPALRQAVPSQVLAGRHFEVRQASYGAARNQVARPNAVAAPKNVPRLRAQIPKAVTVPGKATGPQAWRGMKGMELPRSAVRETPQMREQLQRAGVTPPATHAAPRVTAPRAAPHVTATAPHAAPQVTAPAHRAAPAPRATAPGPASSWKQTTPPRHVLSPQPTRPQSVWTPQELQRHQMQGRQFEQRQYQMRQQFQQRLQQPGYPQLLQRQQQILQQRQMTAPTFRAPAAAPRMAPAPHFAPAPRVAPAPHFAPAPHAPAGGGFHPPAGRR